LRLHLLVGEGHMAFNDSLFQLGMDLTRSSTTQTEDLVLRTPDVDTFDRSGGQVEGQDEKFAGTHLIIDLFGAKRLDDVSHIEATLRQCAEVAGRTVLHMTLHRHGPKGFAGVAVLEGGHITVNTRPEAGFAAVDVFVDGDAKPHLTVAVLTDAFSAADVVLKGHQRGAESATRGWNIEAPVPTLTRLQRPTPRLVRTKRVA
jgi:S-adenosylmethionine decarboxylase